jgi:sugar lactone lactonase YvrE
MAVEGGRVVLEGTGLPSGPESVPRVTVGGTPARVVRSTPTAIAIVVASGTPGGAQPLAIHGLNGGDQFLEVGTPMVTGLHQVDNPIFDDEGRLYVTFSGARGQQAPVSIFRVTRAGAREPFVTSLTNPTSMARDAAGRLYVSSRFDGIVYRVDEAGQAEVFASDLGVACGLAMDRHDNLYVGDRSGTVFRVSPTGAAEAFATLPPSVAAFHLAYAPDDSLFATGPTLSSQDDVYRITPDGEVQSFHKGFGRPQGLALDRHGALFVVEALAGRSGLYRFAEASAAKGAARREHQRPPAPELVVSGPDLIGVAFDPRGAIAVCTSDTVYRFGTTPA